MTAISASVRFLVVDVVKVPGTDLIWKNYYRVTKEYILKLIYEISTARNRISSTPFPHEKPKQNSRLDAAEFAAAVVAVVAVVAAAEFVVALAVAAVALATALAEFVVVFATVNSQPHSQVQLPKSYHEIGIF